jgi:hypothetical protein
LLTRPALENALLSRETGVDELHDVDGLHNSEKYLKII